jgi:hypothetical protein
MLFDRLVQDLKKRNLTVAQLFIGYGLHKGDECRNFILRAINYGRFFGTKNSLFNGREIKTMLDTLLDPIKSNKFNVKYYFLLANSFEKIINLKGVDTQLKSRMKRRLKRLYSQARGLKEDQKRILRALEYFVFKMDSTAIPSNKRSRLRALTGMSYFDPDKYRSDNGKLQVLQIFDHHERHHWRLSNSWFRKYDKHPQTGRRGEKRYTTKNLEVILYRGITPQQNQEFVRRELLTLKGRGAIVTFRGDILYLKSNFPFSIFEGQTKNILFINGACGSAGTIPEYLARTSTDLRIVGYSSTGRGQVTNTLVEMLINASKPRDIVSLLEASSAKIRRHGGDIATIKVTRPGDQLLRYVLPTSHGS